MKRLAFTIFASICLTASAQSQSSSGNAIPVTADNFRRAETDMYFTLFASQGSFGRFEILRDLPHAEISRGAAGRLRPLKRDEIRLNRHRALALCLSMISAQTRSAFVS